MNIEKLIELVANRLSALYQKKATAEQLGDFAAVVELETEIVENESTLKKLKTLI